MSFSMGVCCMTAMAGGKKFPKRFTKPKIWRMSPMRVHLVLLGCFGVVVVVGGACGFEEGRM